MSQIFHLLQQINSWVSNPGSIACIPTCSWKVPNMSKHLPMDHKNRLLIGTKGSRYRGTPKLQMPLNVAGTIEETSPHFGKYISIPESSSTSCSCSECVRYNKELQNPSVLPTTHQPVNVQTTIRPIQSTIQLAQTIPLPGTQSARTSEPSGVIATPVRFSSPFPQGTPTRLYYSIQQNASPESPTTLNQTTQTPPPNTLMPINHQNYQDLHHSREDKFSKRKRHSIDSSTHIHHSKIDDYRQEVTGRNRPSSVRHYRKCWRHRCPDNERWYESPWDENYFPLPYHYYESPRKVAHISPRCPLHHRGQWVPYLPFEDIPYHHDPPYMLTTNPQQTNPRNYCRPVINMEQAKQRSVTAVMNCFDEMKPIVERVGEVVMKPINAARDLIANIGDQCTPRNMLSPNRSNTTFCPVHSKTGAPRCLCNPLKPYSYTYPSFQRQYVDYPKSHWNY